MSAFYDTVMRAVSGFVPGTAPSSVITFPGLANTRLTSWNYELGSHGFGNKELQTYTDQNALLDGKGGLKIVVTRQNGKYLSSRITTKGKLNVQPGTYVEGEIKAPVGKGVWPAFWSVGSEGPWPLAGELNMLEGRGIEPYKVSQAIHLASADDAKKDMSYGWGYKGGTTTLAKPLDERYNSYGVFFDNEEVKFYVNRKKTMHVTRKQAVAEGRTWPFNKPQFLILNVAINSGGSEGVVFPKTMYVKRISLWNTGVPFKEKN